MLVGRVLALLAVRLRLLLNLRRYPNPTPTHTLRLMYAGQVQDESAGQVGPVFPDEVSAFRMSVWA